MTVERDYLVQWAGECDVFSGMDLMMRAVSQPPAKTESISINIFTLHNHDKHRHRASDRCKA